MVKGADFRARITFSSCLPALGQGQGADCHELGQDAVSPEKPVEAATGRGRRLGVAGDCQPEPGLRARSSSFLPSSPLRPPKSQPEAPTG